MNAEGEVAEERVLRPGADCRFHSEWQQTIEGPWTRSSETFVYHMALPTRNFRIVETKTRKVVYAIEVLCSFGAAIVASGGRTISIPQA